MGVNAVRALAARGLAVIALDRSRPDEMVYAYLDGLEHLVTFRQADITDPHWTEVLTSDRVEDAIHAAALTPLGRDEQSRAVDAAMVNVVGTANVVRWAAEVGMARLVHVSTAAVYGPAPGEPIDEDRIPRPDTLYAITKLAGESIALRIGALAGMEVVVARLTHVYGPMERPTAARATMSPIYGWVRALTRGEPLRSSDPAASRDFIHVSDVAEALHAMLVTPFAGETVFNVATGRRVTEEELIRFLGDLESGVAVDVSPTSLPVPSRGPVSSARLSRWTGWAPRFDVEAGCRDYLDWVRMEARGD